MSNVDTRDDLACRESDDVLDWYHPDWFSYDENGELYFIPPAFEFQGRLPSARYQRPSSGSTPLQASGGHPHAFGPSW